MVGAYGWLRFYFARFNGTVVHKQWIDNASVSERTDVLDQLERMIAPIVSDYEVQVYIWAGGLRVPGMVTSDGTCSLISQQVGKMLI